MFCHHYKQLKSMGDLDYTDGRMAQHLLVCRQSMEYLGYSILHKLNWPFRGSVGWFSVLPSAFVTSHREGFICVKRYLNLKLVSFDLFCVQVVWQLYHCANRLVGKKRSRSAILIFKLLKMMPKHCYKHWGGRGGGGGHIPWQELILC